MKKLITKSISIFAIILAFTGCTECVECSFTIPMTDFVETSGERCGTSDEIDDVEEEYEQLAIDAGTTVSCIRN